MTTLKERLRDDLTANLKAHNELETSTLRSVLGTIQTQEKAGKVAVEFNDDEVIKSLAKESKQRLDSATEYAGVGAYDRAARETAEAEFLARYLPVPLALAEVEVMVEDVLSNYEGTPTMRDFGAIMKVVLANAKGRTDGKIVSEIVKRKLA